jgi:response regulator RpfG family c-di-GMP phosphodiesterase
MVGRGGEKPAGEKPVTMLAVDDEPDILEGFAMLLEEGLGARVMTARSGAEGLRILENTPIDLVISDYRMPGMDGCAFLENAHRMAPRVPLVMVTAYPDAELEQRATRIGVHSFLSKGLDPDAFVAEIRHALEEGTPA